MRRSTWTCTQIFCLLLTLSATSSDYETTTTTSTPQTTVLQDEVLSVAVSSTEDDSNVTVHELLTVEETMDNEKTTTEIVVTNSSLSVEQETTTNTAEIFTVAIEEEEEEPDDFNSTSWFDDYLYYDEFHDYGTDNNDLPSDISAENLVGPDVLGRRGDIRPADEESVEQLQKERRRKVKSRVVYRSDTKNKLFEWEKPGYVATLPPPTTPSTRPPSPSDPTLCGVTCPEYEVLETRRRYELRRYPASRWLSQVLITDNRVLAELEGFAKLQDYFHGQNELGTHMNLTKPYITQIPHGKHPGVLTQIDDYTISLLVPPLYDREPPVPLTNDILLDAVEESLVFVEPFESWVWEMTDKFVKNRAVKFMKHLRSAGESITDRYFYLAAYSRPELFQPTYYEIWVYSTPFRNPKKIRPQPRSKDPPLSKVTVKTKKKLCRGVECPSFDVLREYRYGIQKRRYFDTVLVSSGSEDCLFTTLSIWKGFMPLHLYKHGLNSHLEVLEATRPIGLVNVKEARSDNTNNVCPQNMTFSLYLPKRLHASPPITGPAAPKVSVTRIDDLIVYVHTVGGYLLEPVRAAQEIADFTYRLQQFGLCFKKDEYYIAVYDYITRYYGRQNEIWIIADNCKNPRYS